MAEDAELPFEICYSRDVCLVQGINNYIYVYYNDAPQDSPIGAADAAPQEPTLYASHLRRGQPATVGAD